MTGEAGNGWLTCVISICMLAAVEGLYCYSCSGSTSNAPCESDVTGLVNTRTQYDGQYSKDCDLEINQTTCVIETSHGDGKLKSIIRGCSDGFTFSFTEVKLFRHLSPTNQTECAVYMGQVICVTLCRLDYCNGPQIITKTTSSPLAAGVRGQHDLTWLLIFSCFLPILWTRSGWTEL